MQSKSARTVVRNTVLLAGLEGALRLAEFCRGNDLHGLRGATAHVFSPRVVRCLSLDVRRTLVIFSMLRTDLSRISISRSVAMLRAPTGARPRALGTATDALVSEERASIAAAKEE